MTLVAHGGRSIEAVVIGASAGGLDGLNALLPALGPGSGVATFVVLHQPKEGPSRLVELLSSRCAVPVYDAQDKQPIEVDAIYVAPPDYHLLVERGPHIALSSDEPVHFSRPSVDVLFETAADVYGSRLLGIVLSGANQDGAAGLRRIEEAGGLTLVQSPVTAQATAMPEAVLRAAPTSAPLELREIVELLRAIRGGVIHPRTER